MANSPREAHTEGIYRIPDHLLNQKSEAYVPQVVSLGPIHHGNPQVAKGEDQKQWCKPSLPRNKGIPSFDKLVGNIKSDQVIRKIQKCYQRQGNDRPKDEQLGEMMALDGLFLQRFLRDITRKPAYLPKHSDPFEPKSEIEEDIMKLENQIPLFVVNMVLQWESYTDRAFNAIICRACNYLCPFPEMNFSHDSATSDSHLVGFMYENVIRCSKEEKVEDNQKKKSISTLEDSQKKKSSCTLRQAADFYSKKGVKFKAQERPALNEIRFNDKSCTFYLPAIKMDSKTDAVMRNLLAYEALVHKDSAKPLLCYIDLMERLINEPEDVQVLIDGGIIEMSLSNNREVANVWNEMRKVLNTKKGEYIPIDTAVDGVTTFCDSKYRIWYLEFKKKYFSRPWLPAALIGGCFSLLLSLLQTILAWKLYRLQLKENGGVLGGGSPFKFGSGGSPGTFFGGLRRWEGPICL